MANSIFHATVNLVRWLNCLGVKIMEFDKLDLLRPQHYALISKVENFVLPDNIPIPLGQRVQVEYEGGIYKGAVTDYFYTSSGSCAMGVNLEVDAGLEGKYFLASKNPKVTCL